MPLPNQHYSVQYWRHNSRKRRVPFPSPLLISQVLWVFDVRSSTIRYLLECFFVVCWFFFKINFLRKKKIFQEHHQSVKKNGSRSGPTFCRSWSGSKLFAKVISRRSTLGYELNGNQLLSLSFWTISIVCRILLGCHKPEEMNSISLTSLFIFLQFLVCLFGLIFYIPVNNFSVMLEWVGWTSTKRRIKCWLGHNTATPAAVRLKLAFNPLNQPDLDPNCLNLLRKRDKMLGKPHIYLFSPICLINSIKHEHPCKILYICNKRSTHVRSSISVTRGALMSDPLYLQQEEPSCKILYICQKGSTHVRSSISATRGALM